MSRSLGNVIDPLWLIIGIKPKEMQHSFALGNLVEKEVVNATNGMENEYLTGNP